MKINFLNDIIKDESGATAIEYGLIAALIAAGLVAALGTLGGALQGIFGDVADGLGGAGEGPAPAP